MLDINEVKFLLKLKNVESYLPLWATKYRVDVIDNSSVLVGPKIYEGEVILYTETFMLIKYGITDFAVVDLIYVTAKPEVGKKVRVIPYVCKDFNNNIQLVRKIKLPIPDQYQFNSYELAEMIHQIEVLPAPDGVRRVAHIFVDANATNFKFIDPTYDEIEDRPSISFDVVTRKFKGSVIVEYHFESDTYSIILKEKDKIIKILHDVYFDLLGKNLVYLIDDGEWKKIKIEILN